MKIKVLFHRLTLRASLPEAVTPGSSAFDLTYGGEPIPIPSGCVERLGLGFAIALPPDTLALILPRSGLASKENLRPANTPGLIDSDYRGEIIVALENFSFESKLIKPGTRVAQMLILERPGVQFEEVDRLPSTLRGHSGFGSTGGF